MGMTCVAATICMAGLLAAAQTGGPAGGSNSSPSNQPNKTAPAAQPPAVTLDKPVVTLSAKSVKRGDSVRIVIQSVTDASGATVSLGGVNLTAEAQGNTVLAQIPPQHPLGPASVVVVVKGREYPAQETLTVLAAATAPRIDSIQPFPAVPEKGRIALDIFGQGFSTAVLNPQTANDIKLVVDHGARTVMWQPAGVDPSKTCMDSVGNAPDAIHGVVVSESQIRVCNVPYKNEGVLPIGLDQGGPVPSKAESVVVSSWNDDLVRGIAGGIAVALIALVYVLLAFKGEHIVRDRHYRLRAMFLDKKTNTYSLSILQFHLWTAATLFGYSYFAISRLFVQRGGIIPDVPGGVPGIVGIGIGATTAVAAQLIDSVNAKGAGDELPSPSDLVTSGGAIAPDRVQMLVWTFIGVGMFIAAVLAQQPATISGLPEVPSTLMQLMGLSAVGYLGGKYARKPGPNILELSIIPSTALRAGALPQIAAVDATAPRSSAAQALESLKKAAAGLTETTAPAAVREARSAVTALESAVAAAAGVDGSSGLPKLLELRDGAYESAVNAAAELERMGAGTAGSEIARVSASIAQRASAAVEDLTATVGSLVSQAEASAARRATDEAQAFRRTLEFRGANLSAEGIFRATLPGADGKPENAKEYDLPFRMLEPDKNDVRAPVIVVPEENSGNAKFARTLRLNIVPSKLDAADKETYDAIFGSAAKEIVFTIVNPDGQKAIKSVKLPPGEAQRQ